MTKNFDLQDDTGLANDVQKYKYMYDKAYKQHLFSLSQKMSFTQTFFRLDFSLFSLSAFDNILKQRYYKGEP